MNARFEELAEQAGIGIWGDTVFMYNHEHTLQSCDLEKFAELIVRECCSQIREIDSMEIMKHLGVAECG
jgi:hypothetical protein